MTKSHNKDFKLFYNHKEINLSIQEKYTQDTKIDNVTIIEYNKDIESLSKIIHCLTIKQSFFILNKNWPRSYKTKFTKLIKSVNGSHITNNFFIASSGSTGAPKLICHNIKSLFISAERSLSNNKIKNKDHVILSLSPAHIGGLLTITKSLISNTTLITSSNHWLNNIEDYKNIHFMLVPQQLEKLYKKINKKIHLIKNIQSILIGGDSTPFLLKKKCFELKLPLIFSYGLTETCGQITATKIGEATFNSGTPLKNVTLSIKNKEVLISTPTLAKGILTKESFKKISSIKNFKSKDIGVINKDKSLTIMGRINNQFQSGGETVSPEFIEQTLLESELIKHIIVIPIKSRKFGLVPIAIINSLNQIHKLKQHSKNELPIYMQPKKWILWPTSIDYIGKDLRIKIINWNKKNYTF